MAQASERPGDEDVTPAEGSALDRFREELDPVVFFVGAGLSLAFAILFMLRPDAAADLVWGAEAAVRSTINWAILLMVFAIVVFLVFVIVGPWGSIKFGDEDPEYSFFAYFAMLYSAGFAAGVVFWGPTEALFYYDSPSPFFGLEGQTQAAIVPAIQQTLFHWAIPQLAVFTIMGIAIGYYAYNYEDVPLRVSSALTPILGRDNLDGPVAKIIDILAVFATIGGVATSLGFIGSQFVEGLSFQWGIDLGNIGIILIVTVMTVLFTISMVLGVNRGIRRVSNFNMVAFLVIMIATLIVGPTAFLILAGTSAFGGMLSDFVSMSLYTGAGAQGGIEWVNSWTVFYWAWACSWTPFAGLFIARISKGRTLREVAFTGIGATSAATIPWFAFVGGTAVWAQHNGVADFSAVMAGDVGAEVSGFILFDSFPMGALFMIGFMVIVTTFFITSADSSTLAVSMMTTGGKARPSTINRVFWGVMLGVTASILMIIGGVDALQAAAVATGGPFAFVCFFAMLGLIKTFASRHGRVLIQDGAPIIGSRSEEPSTGDVSPTDD